MNDFLGGMQTDHIAALTKTLFLWFKSEKKEFAARVGREGECGRMNEFTLRF
jgi:hypothetical protein